LKELNHMQTVILSEACTYYNLKTIRRMGVHVLYALYPPLIVPWWG